MKLEPKVLEGRVVRLEPFAPELREAVRGALDCDSEAWALITVSGQGDRFPGWWRGVLDDVARGERIAYAVRRLSDGAVVGTTSYLNIRADHRGVEIGSTFYRPDTRGGAVNPECKLLLLEHAFAAGALRVELVTGSRNLRSQAAIAKLGAVREGVLHKHKVTWIGEVRDTVVFSITDEEWPAVRAGLETRLAALNSG